MVRVLSLFAGIGGFDLGLERAGGFETVAICEIEPFQRALLRQHWPNAVQYEDIHDLGHIDCDLICGGFPCQKFSTASRGRRVAADLWPEMYRVVSIIKPTYVVAENVSEDAIRTAADQLAAIGYSVSVRNISGVDCGAPHVRSRWWLVAHPHKEGEFQRALNAEVAKLPQLCAGLWTAETYARAIRVSDGIPHRVHRVEALGNAVLPQIPQVIGRAIMTMRAPSPQTNVSGRWLPIDQADKTITDVQDFPEVSMTIRTSDRYWVRDEDGRTYEAAWSEGNNGREYWWDFEGESPVDPVEFMPHPLDPRFTVTEGKDNA